MAKKAQTTAPDVLDLEYQLAELPSSQHRAGLAGLVLMVEWLNGAPNRNGICKLTRVDRNGATLRVNQLGLNELFNEVYAASLEEQDRDQPLKNKQKEIVPYLRTEEREIIDPKTQKTKKKTVYVYEVVTPKGAFLVDYDKSFDGRRGLWIKLWRDVIWTIFRGVPATRKPFADRANGKSTDDSGKAWRELTEPLNYTVDLPSTYFIGAQAVNADNVPFLDRARFQFLLHFWPFAAQFYVPAVINNEGERQFVGFALAIPDVADLKEFCETLPDVLREQRGVKAAGYRPRDSVVDLAVESALDLLSRFKERLQAIEGARSTRDLLLGVDVVHLEKQGNNIRLLGSTRLDPELTMVDEYTQLRSALWNPIFRRQRILNLVRSENWYAGFDRLLCTLPYEQTIANKHFRHDARESFSGKDEPMNGETETNKNGPVTTASDEALIYRAVGVYLSRKLKSKYQLDWNAVKDNPKEKDRYTEMREKLGRDAFLAIRSRTGQDFIEYFASTICSVAQNMDEQGYISLTQALLQRTDEVRALTMLALSARS